MQIMVFLIPQLGRRYNKLTKENVTKVLKYFICQVLFLGFCYWGIAVWKCLKHNYSPYSSRLTYCLVYALGGASCLVDYPESIK